MELMGYVSLEEMSISGANDVWGWTDTVEQTEYILLGANSGLCFLKIESGGVPHFMGMLPSHGVSSLWRDVKVLGDYAYIVTEAPGSGIQVFDLTQLRNWNDSQGTVAWTETGFSSAFSSAHNIAVHEPSSSVYVLGSNFQSGGVMIFDVSNPLQPLLTGVYGESGYFHDAQIVSYNGPDPDYQGQIILLAANEIGMVVLNVTDPTDIVQISFSTYPNPHYSHQVWLSEDGSFALLGDELDELSNQVSGTRTMVWDMQNLDIPILVGENISDINTTDHNQYIVGELVFQSNYKGGLRVLSAKDWSSGILTEIAFFDVYPETDAKGFLGTWSNYPFFESGLIAVSSIDRGLFVVKQKVFTVEVLDDFWCDSDWVSFNVTVPLGLTGPYYLSVQGVPIGAYPVGITSTPSLVEPGSSTLGYILGSSSFSDLVNPVWVLETAFNRFEANVTFSTSYNSFMYLDNDGDGYGNPYSSIIACTGDNLNGLNYVNNSNDCDDSRAVSFPLAVEVCDFQDNNCNGVIDDNVTLLAWFPDDDNDGFGDPLGEVLMCAPPAGYVQDSSDCNDGQAVIYPGASGTYQGFDNNCDGIFQFSEHSLCPGDFNFDNTINVMDLLEILGSFGCIGPGCTVDLNEDGTVTVYDLLSFLYYIGTACPQ
ncbi:MAG: hypothetical protein COA49_06170 [Bacteroidetes bacterium]|nr:MAG: hypothetical protein COA49_06170 [Bacteroidota bacterium]